MKTILLVEDEPTLQKTLSLALTQEGYEVKSALDGEIGLRLARESKPDIVLLDLILPKMDGFEVLDELKKVNQDIIKHNLMVDEKRSKGIAMNKDIESKKSLITSVVVCRELSKMHETVYRGEVEDIINKIKDSQNDQKGEFVVIIGR